MILKNIAAIVKKKIYSAIGWRVTPCFVAKCSKRNGHIVIHLPTAFLTEIVATLQDKMKCSRVLLNVCCCAAV